MGSIISGKKVAENLLSKAKLIVKTLKSNYSITPKVCIILVGDNYASSIYVRNKIAKAFEIGILTEKIHLPEDTKEEDLIKLISKYNTDSSCHGIIVQLPLPASVNKNKIADAISPNKDVDGFNVCNIGSLCLKSEDFFMVPCTPLGCLSLIKSVQPNIQGKNIVVVGRSNIVGMPLSILLTHNDATVTLCHKETIDLKSFTQKADIVITAIGCLEYFTQDYFSPKSIVIDVGTNHDINTKALKGDVCFDSVSKKVSYITPVPGGVGPMTVAYLMINTIKAACLSCLDFSYKDLYM